MLTEKFALKVSTRSSPFKTFLIFSGAESRLKVFRVQSALSRSGSVLGLVYVFYRSIQQTFCEAGTRDELDP